MILNFELEFMEKKWQQKAKELDHDFYRFEEYYVKHKKCDCAIIVCKHFDKALIKVFAERSKELCDSRVMLSLKIHHELLKDQS